MIEIRLPVSVPVLLLKPTLLQSLLLLLKVLGHKQRPKILLQWVVIGLVGPTTSRVV